MKNRNRMGKFSLGMVAVCLLAGGAMADVMTGLTADNGMSYKFTDGGSTTYDGGSSTTGVGMAGGTEINHYVGRYSQGMLATVVYVFQLPAMSVNQEINTASLTFRTVGVSFSTLSSNIDLYGLGYRGSSDVSKTDYYVGMNDLTDATKIQDNMFQSSVTYGEGTRTTDAFGNANLADYLNAQYANGANEGNYIFLRLNYDSVPSALFSGGGGRINVAMADNTSLAPVLNYTVTDIPEPTAFALMAWVGSSLFRRTARSR